MLRVLLFALCSVTLACSAPRTPPPELLAVATEAGPAASAPQPTDAAADATPDAADAAPLTVHLHFSLEPAGATGERTLLFVSDDGAVREPLATIAAAHRCVVTLGGRHHARPRSQSLNAGCGVDLSAYATLDPSSGGVALGVASGQTSTAIGPPSRTVVFSHGAVPVLDDALPDPSAPACTPGDAGAAPIIDVRVEDATFVDPGQPTRHVIRVRVPALGIDERTEWSENFYCHGTRSPKANLLVLGCSSSETHRTTTVELRDGGLYVDEHEKSYDEDETRPHGGVELACGATLRLPRVHITSPKWSPVGNCPSCVYPRDLCSDPCFEKLTDEDGKLTDEGVACEDRCEATFQKCWHQCMHM